MSARNAKLKALQEQLAQCASLLAEGHGANESRRSRKQELLFVLNQDSGVLAWADPSLDITTDVITLVNQP